MLECSRGPGSEDEDCDANCSSWVEKPYFLEFGSNDRHHESEYVHNNVISMIQLDIWVIGWSSDSEMVYIP
jgi:hypothetical protein